MEFLPDLSWGRRLGRQFLVLWPLKAVGTMSFLALFFWCYFAVLRHPLATPFIMPMTGLDELIPFTPAAYPVYVSLWVYVSLPPAFLGSYRSLLMFGGWIAALCLFCLGIFWFFPTMVPPVDIDWAAYPELAMVKDLDAAGNACPSLHVASAVFSAFWLDRLVRHLGMPTAFRWLNGLQCALIVWSTIATRQHVVLDAVAGVLVGVGFAVASLAHARRSMGAAAL